MRCRRCQTTLGSLCGEALCCECINYKTRPSASIKDVYNRCECYTNKLLHRKYDIVQSNDRVRLNSTDRIERAQFRRNSIGP